MKICWRQEERAVYGCAFDIGSRLRFRMIAEKLPRKGGWDWMTWCLDNTEIAPWRGLASSRDTASVAAADAFWWWLTICPWKTVKGGVPPLGCADCHARTQCGQKPL